ELTDDTAGIVIADRDGNVGSSFNSEQMQTGTAVSDCGAGMPL
ncbi:MAG: isoaspartyl peptidase/L-asparaginase-like protein (Ntn-hydrolase superfamily), partial [Natronomonas sp.]